MSNVKLEDNKAVVRQWFSAFDKGDVETLQKLTSPDFHKRTLGMLDYVDNTYTDHRLEIQEMIAEDNRVMVRLHSSGQHTGELFGVSGTGRRWEGNEGSAIFRFEDGKIADSWQMWNIPMHLEKLGLKMNVSE